jgi:hypothetical protein
MRNVEENAGSTLVGTALLANPIDGRQRASAARNGEMQLIFIG